MKAAGSESLLKSFVKTLKGNMKEESTLNSLFEDGENKSTLLRILGYREI